MKKELLRAAMALRGVTSAQLTESSGLTRARINRLRCGTNPPASEAELQAIAAAVDVYPSALTTRAEWPRSPMLDRAIKR